MKICMLVHQYYFLDARVIRYVDALTAAGVDVDVLALRDPQRSASEQHGRLRVFTIPLARTGRGGYLAEYGLAVVLFSLWLLWMQLRNRYAVIHIHNMPDFLVLAALVPRLLGARLILDIHDPMPEFYMSKYARPADTPTVRLMRFQERLSAAACDAVITANPAFRENLAARGIPAGKITVITNVADRVLFDRARHAHLHPPAGQFTLLYPGTIAPRYGLDVAVRAMPAIVRRVPSARLVIQGPETPHGAELRALAQQLGVGEHVLFPPLVPLEQVPTVMMQADVGIYTALPDPHMSIAVPSKVLEYVMMGLPVVTSRLPALTHLLPEDAVRYFTPGDSEQFAAHMIELAEHRERRTALVARADETFTRQQRWETERRRYFTLLGQLLGPRRWRNTPEDDEGVTSKPV
jgi:glycosyltransferase involved in cell wall biosynthesis